MQVQNLQENYELYSNRMSGLKNIKTKKIQKILLYMFLTCLVLAMFVTVVVAANNVFDNTVYSSSPTYTLKTPGYSSYNSVFSEFQPTFLISIDNKNNDKLIVSTDAVELSKVLEKQNIVLDDTCVLSHSLDTVVYDGMNVVIDSVVYETVNVETQIPFETTTIELQTIPKGTKKVVSNGQNGVMTSTYRRKIVNGAFESEELISQTQTLAPVNEVVQLGVGGTLVGKDGKTYSYSYYLDVSATCYGKADGSGSITATGTLAREGVIAVDPKVIKLGSKVYVKGDYRDIGVCYAEDTGGAIKGNKIDVYLEGTLQQLLQFGRRNMRVFILE